MKKFWIWTALAVVAAVVIAVVGTRRGGSSGDIRIGAVLPLTGDAASYGTSLKRGMDFAVLEINRQGGISGRKLAIIFEDSQADPSKAVSAFNKLVAADRVPMVIGDMFSASTLALAPIAENKKVVLLSPTASAVELTAAGDYIFRIYPSDTYDGNFLARYITERLKARNVAILYLQVASISALVGVFEKEFSSHGGNIVFTEAYQEGAIDFRSQLLKARKADPDLIFFPGYLREMAMLLRQARELGVSKPFVTISTFFDPKVLELAGDCAEGVLFSAPFFDPTSSKPEEQKFCHGFHEQYNQPPDILAGYGYDAVNIAAEALRRSDTFTSDGIKNALYTIKDYPGVTGQTSFDANGDVVKSMRIMQVRNGKFVPLD